MMMGGKSLSECHIPVALAPPRSVITTRPGLGTSIYVTNKCGSPEKEVNRLKAENKMNQVGPHYDANGGSAKCTLEQFVPAKR